MTAASSISRGLPVEVQTKLYTSLAGLALLLVRPVGFVQDVLNLIHPCSFVTPYIDVLHNPVPSAGETLVFICVFSPGPSSSVRFVSAGQLFLKQSGFNH